VAEKGEMTMREAGRRGGQTTWERHGSDHYQRIGQKGGERARRLIARGKQEEQDEEARRA